MTVFVFFFRQHWLSVFKKNHCFLWVKAKEVFWSDNQGLFCVFPPGKKSLFKHLLRQRPSPPQQRGMGRSSLPALSNGSQAKEWEPPIGCSYDRSECD